jgi:RNA polymerase sigma factor (sigma-70 family)
MTTSGDRQRRFETVYREQHGPILGYVLRRTDNPDDAADVLGEVFLTAWRRLDELPAGVEARLWLYGVARRVLANHRRGQRRRTALTERLRDDLAASYRPPEFTGELGQLADAFRRLPAAERELLSLAAWEGLDNGQIATVLGCSRNAVRIRLFRARRRLSAELASAPESRTRQPVPHGDLT